jgi:hypothetical protein
MAATEVTEEGEGGGDDTSSMNSSVFQIVNDLRKHPSEKEVNRSNPSDIHLFASMDDGEDVREDWQNRGESSLNIKRLERRENKGDERERGASKEVDEEDEEDELNLSKYQEDLQYISQSIHEIHEKYRLSSSRSRSHSDSNLLREKEKAATSPVNKKKKSCRKEMRSPSSSPTFGKGKRKEETRQQTSKTSPLKIQRMMKPLLSERRRDRLDAEREETQEEVEDEEDAIARNTIRRVESRVYEDIPLSSTAKQQRRSQNPLSVSYPLPSSTSSAAAAMMRNDALPSSPSFFAPSYRQNLMEGGTVGEVSREIIMELEEKLKLEEIKNNLLLNQIQSMPSNLTVATVSLCFSCSALSLLISVLIYSSFLGGKESIRREITEITRSL